MITVEKKDFLNAIKVVKTATAKGQLQPVLQTVNLKTDKGSLVLTCTDCTNIARAVIEANADEEINICVNVEKLDAIISHLDDIITMEIKGSTIVIKSGSSIFKCLFIQGTDFPEIKIELDGEKMFLSKNDFISGVNKTAFAIMSEMSFNNIISGICFTFNETSCEMAATDGNRLSQVVFDCDLNNKGQYVIPKIALTSVAKIAKDDLQICCKNDNITFYADNFIYSTKLLNGKYPEYNQLIPQTFKKQITIDKDELLKSLEKVSIMANDRTNIMKFAFNQNQLELIAECDTGKAKDKIEIDYNDKELVIAFNYHYLLDGLKVMDSDVILMNINSPSTAVLFIGDYNYLVMPIQIK